MYRRKCFKYNKNINCPRRKKDEKHRSEIYHGVIVRVKNTRRDEAAYELHGRKGERKYYRNCILAKVAAFYCQLPYWIVLSGCNIKFYVESIFSHARSNATAKICRFPSLLVQQSFTLSNKTLLPLSSTRDKCFEAGCIQRNISAIFLQEEIRVSCISARWLLIFSRAFFRKDKRIMQRKEATCSLHRIVPQCYRLTCPVCRISGSSSYLFGQLLSSKVLLVSTVIVQFLLTFKAVISRVLFLDYPVVV